jgi:hypothetical protein
VKDIAMRWRVKFPSVLGLALLICGCGPSDYESFKPSKAQWVIKVTGIDPSQSEKIRAAIDEVSGIEKGSILVNPTGGYVAFKTTVLTSDQTAHNAVRDTVVKKLKELGVKYEGRSKSQLK